MHRLVDWFKSMAPAKAFILAVSATFLIFLFTTLIPAVSNGNKAEENTKNEQLATEQEKIDNGKDIVVKKDNTIAAPTATSTAKANTVSTNSSVVNQPKQSVQRVIVKKITTITTIVSGGTTKILKSVKFVKTNDSTSSSTNTTSTSADSNITSSTSVTTTNGTCKLGKIEVTTDSVFAPAKVTFTNTGDKNVGFYHWSFGDPDSKPHASASGKSTKHAHVYNMPGTYTASVSAYASEADFAAKNPCASGSVTLKIKKQTSTGWVWPTEGKIISVVGMRVQPVTGEYRMHQGIDIKNKKGTTIVAARDGKVVATNGSCHSSRSNCGGGYGNYVIIHHSNGLYSIYAHLSKVNARVGENVNAGHKIGEMGSTGLTPDTHLHFGIGPTLWVNQNVKNPLKLLPKR